MLLYYMARSASGQDEPDGYRCDRLDGAILPARTRCIPQEKFPWKPYNKSFIDQVCSVKMAGYWPRFFFASLWTSTSSWSIHTQKRTWRTWPISSNLDQTNLVINPHMIPMLLVWQTKQTVKAVSEDPAWLNVGSHRRYNQPNVKKETNKILPSHQSEMTETLNQSQDLSMSSPEPWGQIFPNYWFTLFCPYCIVNTKEAITHHYPGSWSTDSLGITVPLFGTLWSSRP